MLLQQPGRQCIHSLALPLRWLVLLPAKIRSLSFCGKYNKYMWAIFFVAHHYHLMWKHVNKKEGKKQQQNETKQRITTGANCLRRHYKWTLQCKWQRCNDCRCDARVMIMTGTNPNWNTHSPPQPPPLETINDNDNCRSKYPFSCKCIEVWGWVVVCVCLYLRMNRSCVYFASSLRHQPSSAAGTAFGAAAYSPRCHRRRRCCR